MKLGFIGAGNMGSAIIGGAISAGVVNGKDITVSDRDTQKLDALKEKYGVNTKTDNTYSTACDIVFLCVKPNVLADVINEISGEKNSNTVFVSIAAGQSTEKIVNLFGEPVKVVRVMPNTPALVGEGMSAVCANTNVTENELKSVLDILRSFGRAEVVSESLMDTVTAVSGSSPAYVFMFIEAMADAAVKGGMTRDMAYTFAAQSVLGSAKMVLETGMHPGALKDMVCSPGGTTIDAVAVLENEGMRNAVMKAMEACIKKSKSM
ncbi:MAG: pyrroline-5-carboxylate reductase [Clostridia bacterium]|nr:pyrroline-5-carboxylate reductase [Clostridia bacterium]